MSALKVFISHAHEDKGLAEAWRELIEALSSERIKVWHSSDERAGEGIGTGKWRQWIRARIGDADAIAVFLTPGSHDKEWLVWESGFARGQGKELIPVTYFVDERGIHEVFKTQSIFEGDKEPDVMKLCRELVLRAQAPERSEPFWKHKLEEYFLRVSTERRGSLVRSHFLDHFHNRPLAEKVKGPWFAKWTQSNKKRGECVFVVDSLEAWTTDDRIRFVGVSNKEGIERLLKPDEEVKHYPMEGVVSGGNIIAMSYWSPDEIGYCGTALLRRDEAGHQLQGTWQGFTAGKIGKRPRIITGRVYMARHLEDVEAKWSDLPSCLEESKRKSKRKIKRKAGGKSTSRSRDGKDKKKKHK